MDGQGNITMTGTAAPIPVRSPAAAVPAVQGSPYPNVSPAQVYPPTFQKRPSNFTPQTAHSVPYQAAGHPYAASQATPYSPYQANRVPVPQPTVYNPNAPRPVEVFQLSDAANAAIPADIREQFHCDDQGRVLFFSSRPLDIAPSTRQKLGHSLKYLAAKEERRKKVEQRKRKAHEQEGEREENAKRARADEEAVLATRVESLTNRAIETMTNQVVAETNKVYKTLYQDQAEEARVADSRARVQRILMDQVAQGQTAAIKTHSQEATFVSLKGNAMYMDDIQPRT